MPNNGLVSPVPSASPLHSAHPRPVPRWRDALLVGLAGLFISLGLRGFSGARWSDVPIIKSFAHPELYRQDPFIMALHDGTPAAYSYQLIAGFVRLLPDLPLDWSLFALYLPVTALTLVLLFRVAILLSGEMAAALLFLLLYLSGFRLFTVGSAILHSAELTPQTLALPLQIAAVEALLRRRLVLAGGLVGVAFNLHAPTSVYFGGALIVHELLWIRQLGWRAAAVSIGLLALAAAPTLLGSLLKHADQLPLWALYLARTELATDISLTVNFSSRGLIVYNAIGLTLTSIGLVEIIRSRHTDQLDLAPSQSASGRRLTVSFCLATALMCLGALLFFDLWIRSPLATLVARLQLPRSAWLVDVLGLIFLARFLTRQWREKSLSRPLVLLLIAPMLVAPPDFVPLDPLLMAAVLLALIQRLAASRLERLFWWLPWPLVVIYSAAGALKVELRELDFELSLRSGLVFAGLAAGWALTGLLGSRRAREWQMVGSIAACGLVAAVGVTLIDEWLTNRAHRGSLQAAEEFQTWARTATPVDSVFLMLPSEPNNNTFYERAERAIFLVRERANQAVYFSSHSFEFERRVRALGVEQPLRYREELDPAYRRLTEEQVRALARDFGVTHFVPARAGSFSFPIVYQSGGWTVYSVS